MSGCVAPAGRASKQADIVIYDAQNQANFLRKVFPVEIVYAVIEVKTSMGSTEAGDALANLKSVNSLEFRPALTPYWQTRTERERIQHDPPGSFVFTYRTTCEAFETFAGWWPWEFLHEGTPLKDSLAQYPEIRTLTVGALDQGMIRMESTNGYIQRFFTIAGDGKSDRIFIKKFKGQNSSVDPAKALFFFMHRLWSDLEFHQMHPGFDIRSYMSSVLTSYL